MSKCRFTAERSLKWSPSLTTHLKEPSQLKKSRTYAHTKTTYSKSKVNLTPFAQ